MNSKSILLLALLFFLSFVLGCGRQQEALNSSDSSIMSGAIIVGDVDWKDVTELDGSNPIRQNAKKVADLSLPAVESRCTGFLIGEDVLMTNHHCVTTAADAVGAKANFGHETGQAGEALTFTCDEFIGNNEEFDFALLRCKGKPGRTLGVVTLSGQNLQTGDKIYVVQQNCDYYLNRKCDWSKKYARGTIKGTNSDGDYKHDADTLGGSSGSPVFSEASNLVVALHHAGYGNNGLGRGVENYAVPMSKVVAKLRSNFPVIAGQIGLGGNPPGPSNRPTYEPNNSTAYAASVSLPFATEGLSIDTAADKDWFKFSVVVKSSLTIKLQMANLSGDLDVKLFSSGGSLVGKSESVKQTEEITATLRPGVYYLQVYGYQGATNNYSLKISK
ncbi:MAG: trypsin-like peptidase domain-containing protein [Bdellovibrio sp.]|nr:trypsin-like peptidase domain-containing protein [Bdellovibrio sp.]